jgi:hypothetical protein
MFWHKKIVLLMYDWITIQHNHLVSLLYHLSPNELSKGIPCLNEECSLLCRISDWYPIQSNRIKFLFSFPNSCPSHTCFNVFWNVNYCLSFHYQLFWTCVIMYHNIFNDAGNCIERIVHYWQGRSYSAFYHQQLGNW